MLQGDYNTPRNILNCTSENTVKYHSLSRRIPGQVGGSTGNAYRLISKWGRQMTVDDVFIFGRVVWKAPADRAYSILQAINPLADDLMFDRDVQGDATLLFEIIYVMSRLQDPYRDQYT